MSYEHPSGGLQARFIPVGPRLAARNAGLATRAPAATGANIVVRIPADETLFDNASEPVPGTFCTSPLTTYLDLWCGNEREREAARRRFRARLIARGRRARRRTGPGPERCRASGPPRGASRGADGTDPPARPRAGSAKRPVNSCITGRTRRSIHSSSKSAVAVRTNRDTVPRWKPRSTESADWFVVPRVARSTAPLAGIPLRRSS